MRYFIFAAILLIGCSRNSYEPSAHLTLQEQDEMLWKVMRYIAQKPEGLSSQEKFYDAYDDYYREQQAKHAIEAWYTESQRHYFLISRAAPSLTEKRVAIGGTLSVAANGEIQEYEEVFRTWKMQPDSLRKKAMLLFDKMVKGESLERYQTRFTAPEEYIEFPDERTYYDKEAREWRMK